MQCWDDMLPQAQDTLNMLRTWRINNISSEYEILEGTFDYNKTPLAPPGTKAIVYDDPTNCITWGVHGSDRWYVGPAMQHFRCYKFIMEKIKANRIA